MATLLRTAVRGDCVEKFPHVMPACSSASCIVGATDCAARVCSGRVRGPTPPAFAFRVAALHPPCPLQPRTRARLCRPPCLVALLSPVCSGWCADREAGVQGHVCAEQAGPQRAGVVVLPHQVRSPTGPALACAPVHAPVAASGLLSLLRPSCSRWLLWLPVRRWCVLRCVAWPLREQFCALACACAYACASMFQRPQAVLL